MEEDLVELSYILENLLHVNAWGGRIEENLT